MLFGGVGVPPKYNFFAVFYGFVFCMSNVDTFHNPSTTFICFFCPASNHDYLFLGALTGGGNRGAGLPRAAVSNNRHGWEHKTTFNCSFGWRRLIGVQPGWRTRARTTEHACTRRHTRAHKRTGKRARSPARANAHAHSLKHKRVCKTHAHTSTLSVCLC